MNRTILLPIAIGALAVTLLACATNGVTKKPFDDQILGQPKAYFYEVLGSPVDQGTDAQGVEWLEWEGTNVQMLSS